MTATATGGIRTHLAEVVAPTFPSAVAQSPRRDAYDARRPAERRQSPYFYDAGTGSFSRRNGWHLFHRHRCYVYNAEGQRVRKITASTSVDYLYEHRRSRNYRTKPSGTLNQGEVYAGSRHLAPIATPQHTSFTLTGWGRSEPQHRGRWFL